MAQEKKTLIQCDFDGTITEKDVSFLILDAFGDGNWRQLLREYSQGKITVGQFNRKAFATVKADRESLQKLIRSTMIVRPGFSELMTCCLRRGFRFVVVSNGLDFYIREILDGIGLADIEVFAAKTRFHEEGLDVRYVGPDGSLLDDGFKSAYLKTFRDEGYRVIYIGNGTSDILPASECNYVFATDDLLAHFRQTDLDYAPFIDFNQVVKVLESL